MPAGNDEYKFKQDDTRLEGDLETAIEEDRTRIGTIVDTRAAAAAGMSEPKASADDLTRIGTKVDTRVGGSGDPPVVTDRMRDGS